jgi:hypothetical protein
MDPAGERLAHEHGAVIGGGHDQRYVRAGLRQRIPPADDPAVGSERQDATVVGRHPDEAVLVDIEVDRLAVVGVATIGDRHRPSEPLSGIPGLDTTVAVVGVVEVALVVRRDPAGEVHLAVSLAGLADESEERTAVVEPGDVVALVVHDEQLRPR